MDKRTDHDHRRLTGTDVDLEISLKEYGIAWIEEETEVLFYYGTNQKEMEGHVDYVSFDFCSLNKNIDIYKEYDWIDEDDWNSIYECFGIDQEAFDEMPFTEQIYMLLSHYGYENIFGSSYWEGLTYDQIMADRNKQIDGGKSLEAAGLALCKGHAMELEQVEKMVFGVYHAAKDNFPSWPEYSEEELNEIALRVYTLS